MFFVVEREGKREKMIIGIFGFGFLSKNGRFLTQNCFQKNLLELFFSSLFGPRCQKRKFWTPAKKEEKID